MWILCIKFSSRLLHLILKQGVLIIEIGLLYVEVGIISFKNNVS